MVAFDKDFNNLKDGSIYLVIPSTTNYQDVIIKILQHLVNDEKKDCIYITTSRTSFVIKHFLDEHRIDTDKIKFIDLVNRSKEEQLAGSISIHAQHLSAIEIAMKKEIEHHSHKPEETFIFLDSLSGLLVHNSQKDVAKFMYSLVKRIRNLNTNLVALSLDKEINDETINILSEICDKTFRTVHEVHVL